MKKILTKKEFSRYNFVVKLVNKFGEKRLNDFEDSIFEELDNKRRVVTEFQRLKNDLKNQPDKLADLLNDIVEINDLIKFIDIDPTIFDKISVKIVSMQIDNGVSVRLFSAIPKIKDELEYLKFSRENNIKKSKKL